MASHHPQIVREQVEQLLYRTPSFTGLDAPTQRALCDSMTRGAEFLSASPAQPYATQLAPDLQQRLSRQPEETSPPQQPTWTRSAPGPDRRIRRISPR